MIHVDLKFFSGTGNSYRILDTCREVFIQNGCNARLSSILDDVEIDREADVTGFCFPVYAFGIPRICRNYLRDLPKLAQRKNAFVLITAGDRKEAGFSVQESRRLLKKKGYDVVYSSVIHMPANWTVLMNPPSLEEALTIIDLGVGRARAVTEEILKGVVSHHRFNYPPRYSKFGFYKDYYLFKWLGLRNYWREFRTDETCDGCGLCLKLCPTRSIQIINRKPRWFKTCEQCMRCVNYCPQKAIFQKGGGSIKGKNTYYEPSFRP